ncbi:MAG: ABC transporter permease subunit [Polyangiales bacterium]
MSAAEVLVVYKKTTYQRYAAKGVARLQSLIDSADVTVRDLMQEHDSHLQTIAATKQTLKNLGVHATFCHRTDPLPDRRWDMIVTLGGDGTLLWVSHLADADTPMLSINSAPKNSVGYFSAGDASTVEQTLQDALEGNLKQTRLSRMQVEVDDSIVSKRVLNDILFCHACPAATARYVIELPEGTEAQMSSGIWAGPAAGSTAAIRSAGGRVLPVGSKKLQFVVREPYHGNGEKYAFEKGMVQPPDAILLHCQMTDGRLYMDGAQKTHPVHLGQIVRLSLSNEPLQLRTSAMNAQSCSDPVRRGRNLRFRDGSIESAAEIDGGMIRITRVYAIALNTFREAVRDKVLYGVLAIASLVLLLTLALAQLSLDQQARVIVDLGMASISLFSVIIAVFLGSSLLYKEIERKTLYVILPKPIYRYEFLFGKYLGIVMTAVVFVSVMGAIQLWVTAYQGEAPLRWLIGVPLAWLAVFSLLMWRARDRTAALLPMSLLALGAGAWLVTQSSIELMPLIASLCLNVGEVSVLTAIALLFSSFSTPFLTGAFTLGVWLVGRSAHTMVSVKSSVLTDEIKTFLRWLAEVIPNFDLFVPGRSALIALKAQYGGPWLYVGTTLGYASLYTIGILIVAALIFRRRDFI